MTTISDSHFVDLVGYDTFNALLRDYGAFAIAYAVVGGVAHNEEVNGPGTLDDWTVSEAYDVYSVNADVEDGVEDDFDDATRMTMLSAIHNALNNLRREAAELALEREAIRNS